MHLLDTWLQRNDERLVIVQVDPLARPPRRRMSRRPCGNRSGTDSSPRPGPRLLTDFACLDQRRLGICCVIVGAGRLSSIEQLA